MNEEVDYEFLNRWLPHGAIKKLASKWGYSRQHAHMILSNSPRLKKKNVEFIQEACQIAIERASIFIACNEKINSLKQSIKSYERA